MPFFGQVWLWSLAGFLVGALLCWALVARPARRRVIELEDSLADARRAGQEPAPTLYQPEYRDRPFGDFEDHPSAPDGRGREETAHDADTADETLIAPPEASPEPQEPPPLAEAESTQLMAAPPVGQHPPVEAPPEVGPEWSSRADSADSPHDEHFVDDLHDERDRQDEHDLRYERDLQAERDLSNERDRDGGPAAPGTIFTQHTTPISAALIRRIDDRGDTSLVDDLDDHDAADLHAADHHGDHPDGADHHGDRGDYGHGEDGSGSADDPIDAHRGHFADALTPDDEDDSPRAADNEPVTRYLPPVPAEDAEPEPLPQRTATADSEALPKRAPAAEAEPLPKRAPAADTEALPKRAPAAGAEPLPKRVPADDVDSLPKRTPGGETRRAPVGEATAYSPWPTMFTPAGPDADRPRHSLPSGPAAESTAYAAAVQPQARPRQDAPPASRPEPAPTVFAPSVPEPVEPAVEEAAAQPGSLPKRVPKKPGDRFPFGVRTGAPEPAPSTPAASSQTAAEAERSRSLFEPVTPADEPGATKALPAAPSRPKRGSSSRASQVLPGGVDTFVPPGPFGPGSAMPLPGGNSPSSEYRVKASVTALRYCSPESPKFDRTVAEVWFRSVADAERVGFRPLG